MAGPCPECLAWIAELGLTSRQQLAQIAADRGTSLAQARADILTALHAQHTARTRSFDD